eukprot:scaffold287428_cov35-Tisochrysis_lutea.AAC.2
MREQSAGRGMISTCSRSSRRRALTSTARASSVKAAICERASAHIGARCRAATPIGGLFSPSRWAHRSIAPTVAAAVVAAASHTISTNTSA